MRKTWCLAWIVMVICQILTVWLGRHSFPTSPGMIDGVDRELLELLKLTNQKWCSLLPAAPVLIESASSEEMLLKRESLILRLQALETALLAGGSEVEVADLFENWLDGRNGDFELYPVYQYISRLLAWMEPYAVRNRSCDLERLTLHPDERSGFPSLSFELAGEPASMALSLLGAEDCAEAWRLNELDLYRPEREGIWWMRGSLSFIDGSLPE